MIKINQGVSRVLRPSKRPEPGQTLCPPPPVTISLRRTVRDPLPEIRRFWHQHLPPLCCIIPSSLGKYRRSFKRHQKEFLALLLGRIFNIYQVPNHKSHLLAIYIICHFPLVFLSPTSQKFVVLFALFFVRHFLVRSVSECNLVA